MFNSCWWPGYAMSLDFSSHDIDLVCLELSRLWMIGISILWIYVNVIETAMKQQAWYFLFSDHMKADSCIERCKWVERTILFVIQNDFHYTGTYFTSCVLLWKCVLLSDTVSCYYYIKMCNGRWFTALKENHLYQWHEFGIISSKLQFNISLVM